MTTAEPESKAEKRRARERRPPIPLPGLSPELPIAQQPKEPYVRARRLPAMSPLWQAASGQRVPPLLIVLPNFHFGRRPAFRGLNCSMSCRRTRARPPISRVSTRWCLMSEAIAWRDTPRIRAASACEIHSSGEPSDKCLDIDKIFLISSNLDSTPNALIGKEARGDSLDGRTSERRRRWRRRLKSQPASAQPSFKHQQGSVPSFPAPAYRDAGSAPFESLPTLVPPYKPLR